MTETKVDMAVQEDSDGIYDISIGDDGDYAAAYGYETSIYMSVECNSSAAENEVSDILRRGGWAGNEHNGTADFEVGSKLWLKHQAKKTLLDKNEAVSYVQQCLSHFVPDRAKRVTVTGDVTNNGIVVTATILRYSGETDNILFELWDKTRRTS